MLKIRLMRIGTNKKPFYRVVVVEELSKRTGGYIELLGTYNPLTEPKDIKLNKDRIDYWTKKGAQPSTGYLRIIGKAPQRPPRKPKKEKKQAAPVVTPTVETPTQAEPSKEMAKSSESEVTGAVESIPNEGTTQDSSSQQTRSEPQNENLESKNTELSDASATDKPTPSKPENK